MEFSVHLIDELQRFLKVGLSNEVNGNNSKGNSKLYIESVRIWVLHSCLNYSHF